MAIEKCSYLSKVLCAILNLQSQGGTLFIEVHIKKSISRHIPKIVRQKSILNRKFKKVLKKKTRLHYGSYR